MSERSSNSSPQARSQGPFKLVAFDMDSTLIQAECIDEIAKMHGVGDEVSSVTEAAMRGELDFTESLARRVKLLNGFDVKQLAYLRECKIELMPGAHELMSALRRNNIKTAILSGGFDYFASYYAEWLDIDAYFCNDLEIKDGQLTGRTLGPIIDAQAKADRLIDLARQWGIPLEQTASVGDGANDLKVMAAAGLGVAFCAKPAVQEQADVAVNAKDLTELIPLLGLD